MEDVKHRVEAVSNRQFLCVSPDTKMQERIDINIANIQPALMLIDIVDFSEIKNGLSFVDSQVFFNFVFLFISHL